MSTAGVAMPTFQIALEAGREVTPVGAPTPSPRATARSARSKRTLVPVSATLAVNEAIARRRAAGEPVLPMGFGEAGLPTHPALRAALAAASGRNAYGPVAGLPALRESAAGYWARRSLATDPDQVVSGPGSKALLFGVLLALGDDVAVPQPSWVSYAAQAAMIGVRAHFAGFQRPVRAFCIPRHHQHPP